MMLKFSIFLSLIFAVSGFSAFGQTKYETYANARFGYLISYPANLIPQGEATNGDGQIFSSDDGTEMRVYGSNLLLNETLKKEYAALLKDYGASATYKTIGKNFFVISGKKDGKIFYRKTIENADGTFITFTIEYDEAKRTTYDKIVTAIVKSLKT